MPVVRRMDTIVPLNDTLMRFTQPWIDYICLTGCCPEVTASQIKSMIELAV